MKSLWKSHTQVCHLLKASDCTTDLVRFLPVSSDELQNALVGFSQIVYVGIECPGKRSSASNLSNISKGLFGCRLMLKTENTVTK